MFDSVSSCPPPATVIVEVESRCHGRIRGGERPRETYERGRRLADAERLGLRRAERLAEFVA